MKGWLYLGRGSEVRIEEIAALHEAMTLKVVENLAWTPFHGDAEAVVMLRNGKSIPAYISARSLRKKLRGEART